MLVGCQRAGIGRQVCLSVKQLWYIGRYVGRSNSCGRKAGMLVGQTAVVSRQVCWSVEQLW